MHYELQFDNTNQSAGETITMMTTISSIKITSEGYRSNEFLTKLPKFLSSPSLIPRFEDK
jgi:hypothetical protein